MPILFFIGVTKDDNVAVVGRPKKLTVQFTKESSGELFIPQNDGEAFLLVRRENHH
jgi:hypothetical protein